MAKDKTIGFTICGLSLIILVGWTLWAIVGPLMDWTYPTERGDEIPLLGIEWPSAYWALALPIFIAMIVVLGIAAWIGYTIATTPPPTPLEPEELEELELGEGEEGEEEE